MDNKQYTAELAKNINKKLKEKQAALNFDDTPTEGSTNPVTSDGVKKYVDKHSGTTYRPGENIIINNKTISAIDTIYTAGHGIGISPSNSIYSNVDYVAGNGINIERSASGNKETYTFNLGLNITSGDGIGITKSGNNLSIYSKLKGRLGVNLVDGIYLDVSSFSYNNSNNIFTNEWQQKNWNGLSEFDGDCIWTDGDNIYYSKGTQQYVLDKTTDTWNEKTWYGYNNFYGYNVWTDGENIYYSGGYTHYRLNKDTSTWTSRDWEGLNFEGRYVVNFKGFTYTRTPSLGKNYYKLDKSTPISKWKLYSLSLGGNFFPTKFIDGDKMYAVDCDSPYFEGYVYTATPTGEIKSYKKVWSVNSGISDLRDIYNTGYFWTDGQNFYYNNETDNSGNTPGVLNKVEDKWYAMSWKGLSNFGGQYVWSDGNNIYYSRGNKQYVLKKSTYFEDTKTKLKYNNYSENINNKVTSISSSSTDEEYPTAKCVYNLVNAMSNIPTPPTAAGTYTLQVTVDSEGKPVYTWILNS